MSFFLCIVWMWLPNTKLKNQKSSLIEALNHRDDRLTVHLATMNSEARLCDQWRNRFHRLPLRKSNQQVPALDRWLWKTARQNPIDLLVNKPLTNGSMQERPRSENRLFTKGQKGSALLNRNETANQMAKCRACGVLIRGPYISAIGHCFCVDHFTCSNCSVNLIDCGFVEENGKLYCERDFEQYLAPRCVKCSQSILKVRTIRKIEWLALKNCWLFIFRNVFMQWKRRIIRNVLLVLPVRNRLGQVHFMWKKVNRTVWKVTLSSVNEPWGMVTDEFQIIANSFKRNVRVAIFPLNRAINISKRWVEHFM